MPKRKSNTYEDQLNHLTRKLRKLERKIRSNGDKEPNTSNEQRGLDMPSLEPSDFVQEVSESDPLGPLPDEEVLSEHGLSPILTDTHFEQGVPSTSDTTQQPEVIIDLDTETLEILGEDPATDEKYGKDIRQELASRFEHIVKEGLPKDTLKEIMSKYMIPSNCQKIDAPKINPEIKVAVPEAILKRDKGIEQKQKQLANAISCLAEIISMILNSKEKNNEILKQLMDLGRLLCDRQHNDSTTRRNLIMFTLKKDLKEHIASTKIDSFLFGDNLSETLKIAKNINKSAVELKADLGNKTSTKLPKRPGKNLNYRAPAPAYRQPAQLRRGEPAAPRAPPPPPHASSSRMLPRQLPPPTQRRRRY